MYFYGTGETGSVKSEDLDPYDEKNIARYNTDRQLKKPDYKEAVDQIQAAIAGNLPVPIPLNASSAVNESAAESNVDDISADETELRIAEEVPTPVVVSKKRPAVAKVKPESHELLPPVTGAVPEAKENDEKISRSGRKIKEKKMNMDEMDPDEMFKPSALKRYKLDLTKPKQTILTESNAIDEFRASKMHILQDPVKKALLETQFDLIHAIQDIKLALGLGDADVDRSIELLEQFDSKILPQVTRIMLLKYPNILDTVKRLRKYIGNLNSWGLEEDQIKEFNTKAEKIRTVAAVVYDKLKVRPSGLFKVVQLMWRLSRLSSTTRLTSPSGANSQKSRKGSTRSTTC